MTSSASKVKFESVPLADFWAYAARGAPELAYAALRVLLPFVTTDLCESGFSTYKSNQMARFTQVE